jgi:uncharacterized protein (DUF2252 family)
MDRRVAECVEYFGDTLSSDRCHLLNEYRYVHLARKVGGVGSVGTRAWIALLLGRDKRDPLFLQIKQARGLCSRRAYIKPNTNTTESGSSTAQRLMQAVGDGFLGWLRSESFDGVERGFVARHCGA